MRTKKYWLTLALMMAFLLSTVAVRAGVVTPAADSASMPRPYYVRSDSSILKGLLGVRHRFPGAFSTRLSSTQLGALKLLGVTTEPVSLYEVLRSDRFGTDSSSECSPSDQYPWGVERVNGGSGGEGIVVAVLDTGVDQDHPDLVNNIDSCVAFGYPTCEDGHGHGTHVAGTILANGKIVGVAPEASLMAIKVCDDSGRCYGDAIAKGIYYAVDGADEDPNTGDGAQIISMSFGGSYIGSQELAALDYAAENDVLLVAAAGNNGPRPNSMVYPAAYRKVMGIAAIREDEKVAKFSSRGLSNGDSTVDERELDLTAPGVSVESTWSDGCYHVGNGTSMATPHVSGLAAKLWQGSAGKTRDYLNFTIAKDLYSSGHDKYSGFGLPIAPACVSDEDCGIDELCCSGQCRVPVCSVNADCDDGNACTEDACGSPGTCDASCSYTEISECVNGDGCCPVGCEYATDTDCPEVDPCLSCHRGVCDGKCHPTKEDSTCPDCP